MNCRFCTQPVVESFVDLGLQPLANSYVKPERVGAPTTMYPLHVRVCGKCLLVQLPELASREEIFSEYAYMSGASTTWTAHCARFAEEAISRFALARSDLVIEVASNDGHLLHNFVERQHRVLGIEPAANIAEYARNNGVPTLTSFFGMELARKLASEGQRPKLLIGNNVLAHVPDINDFVGGLAQVLHGDGVVSLEFPHLLQLIARNQFDTIYHEHFSYLSLFTTRQVLSKHGLRIFDVAELPTHGGSLRVLACRNEHARATTDHVERVLQDERASGLHSLEAYRSFTQRVQETKWALLELLIQLRRRGKRIVGYGAPAKGNTLLNYCGIRTDLLDYTVDRNPLKQGTRLPGTLIPVRKPEDLLADKPDYVLILPWNIADEIREQLDVIRSWGGQFIVPIPEPRTVA